MDNMASFSARSTPVVIAGSDCQESDVFSDDSGVDLRLQTKKVDESGALNLSLPESRRNKRKSSEPKRRKDVLQMKRFRWDTDEENDNEVGEIVDPGPSGNEMDDAFHESERPSSGDSGCLVEPLPSRKRRSKKLCKPPAAEEVHPLNFVKPVVPLPSQRQSVIRKREMPGAITPTSSTVLVNKTKTHNEPVPQASTSVNSRICSATTTKFPAASVYGHPVIPGAIQDVSAEEDSSEVIVEGQRSGVRPRNYKSMSRQRRIEANARERTRVHTISAAFESLRRAVPAYAHNQKLSKLAILRIASAYIVALACLNEQDYSQEQNKPSLDDCVEQCTRTIQAEGKSRRRTKD